MCCSCCCFHRSVCSGAASSYSTGNGGKRAHTCERCAVGGSWVHIVFNRWELWGGVHVCWGPPRVCFSSVCQQVNSLFILAAKLTGHTPLFTHSLSTYPSVYSLTHSICTSTSSFSSISVSLPGKLTHSLCLINP